MRFKDKFDFLDIFISRNMLSFCINVFAYALFPNQSASERFAKYQERKGFCKIMEQYVNVSRRSHLVGLLDGVSKLSVENMAHAVSYCSWPIWFCCAKTSAVYSCKDVCRPVGTTCVVFRVV